MKTFPSGPTNMTQVCNVAFGKDFSGPGEAEEEFLNVFRDSAGCPSWFEKEASLKVATPRPTSTVLGGHEDPPKGTGLRQYPDAPLAIGDFSSVVYSAHKPLACKLVESEGAAGAPSWVVQPRGLSTTAQHHSRQQSKLRQRSRHFLQRAQAHVDARAQAEQARSICRA